MFRCLGGELGGEGCGNGDGKMVEIVESGENGENHGGGDVFKSYDDFDAQPVVEGVVEHGPELLPGHVGVRVHHLEPVHAPARIDLLLLTSWAESFPSFMHFTMVSGLS